MRSIRCRNYASTEAPHDVFPETMQWELTIEALVRV